MLAALCACALLLLPALALALRTSMLFRLTDTLSGICAGIVTGVSKTVMWAGLAIVLIQVAVVIMRYVFGINYIWLQELIIWLFGIMFLLTAAYALLVDEHVRVDIFYRDAPPRRKALVNFIGTYLFLFPVCILIVWAAGPYIYRAWDVMEGSREASGLPGVFLLKSMIPAFAILVALAGFTLASQSVAVLSGHATEEAS
ncbi:TRAP transporter small permease subunit [Aquisalinus luteolus]|nr:TRAP transporter small permease subunit [Aquisalinus luteolus]